MRATTTSERRCTGRSALDASTARLCFSTLGPKQMRETRFCGRPSTMRATGARRPVREYSLTRAQQSTRRIPRCRHGVERMVGQRQWEAARGRRRRYQYQRRRCDGRGKAGVLVRGITVVVTAGCPEGVGNEISADPKLWRGPREGPQSSRRRSLRSVSCHRIASRRWWTRRPPDSLGEIRLGSALRPCVAA